MASSCHTTSSHSVSERINQFAMALLQRLAPSRVIFQLDYHLSSQFAGLIVAQARPTSAIHPDS